jgi:hypothetical protein
MNIRSWIAVAAIAALVVACIPSVYPYYTAKDVSFDPVLLGEWIEDDEHWVFTRHPRKEEAYQLRFTDGDGTDELTATLFTLGEHRFLDVIPDDVELDDNHSVLVAGSVFVGHLVLHVAAIEPRLRMALVEVDWLEDFIEENPKVLSHVVHDDRILLTGQTRELQRFLRKHVDGGELFADYGDLRKTTGVD